MIDIDWRPNSRKLRDFGIICLVAFAAIGSWIFWRHGFLFFGFSEETSRVTGVALWGLAVVSAGLGLLAPRALVPLYVGLTLVSFPIGLVVSFAVLALVYYLLITPLGLFFRLTGRDPLCLRRNSELSSYWVARKPVTDKTRYFRQF